MDKQLCYNDVSIGDQVPSLIKRVTTRQLVMWAGASGDYQQIHYDKDFAIAHDLPGIIVHGQLACSFLGQLLTDWVGDAGEVIELDSYYVGVNLPNEDLTCKGEVTDKYIQDGKDCVECNIWVENSKGRKTVKGRAVVSFQTRSI